MKIEDRRGWRLYKDVLPSEVFIHQGKYYMKMVKVNNVECFDLTIGTQMSFQPDAFVQVLDKVKLVIE